MLYQAASWMLSVAAAALIQLKLWVRSSACSASVTGCPPLGNPSEPETGQPSSVIQRDLPPPPGSRLSWLRTLFTSSTIPVPPETKEYGWIERPVKALETPLTAYAPERKEL